MIRQCIILSGGFGTRLRSVVSDVPKVLAPVNNFPFLHYLLIHLEKAGIHNIILATGYKHELIADWIQGKYPKLSISFSIEEEPLGTGGAIRKALSTTTENDVLILNGDSFFDIHYDSLFEQHLRRGACCSLALKFMRNFDRYGCVETNQQGRITAFLEKQYRSEGSINAGVYLINRIQFLSLPFPEKFSMEKDYLEALLEEIPIYAFTYEGYFIDIGIPEDFERVQTDFKARFA